MPASAVISRRDLMALAAWAATAAACRRRREPGASTSTTTTAAPVAPGPAATRPPSALSADELLALDAITARILPEMPGAPGARRAHVARFIDRQLAAPELAPALPAVRAGLAALDELARRDHGRPLAALDASSTDALIDGLARGTLPVARLPQAALFRALHALTLEGYLSDPAHGGNADMVGWKAIGFPEPPLRTPGGARAGGAGGGQGHDHH